MKGKNKYIGKHVYAGGELNGTRGYIVDVEDEYDDFLDVNTVWFCIKDEFDGSFHRYAKEEITEIGYGEVGIPLE